MAEFDSWNATPWTEAELEAMGIRSALTGGRIFCGVTEESFAINGQTFGWKPGSKITWGLTFSGLGKLSASDVKDCITTFTKEISDACDLTFEYIANADFANIYLIRQRLDGPAGVLADMQIPPANATPDNTRLRGRFDDGEHWTIAEAPPEGTIDLYRTGLHEWLHACGLGHKPANVAGAALIAPTYSRTLRNLQALDIEELRRRHGKATAVAPAPPIPSPEMPVPGALPVNYEGVHTIEQGGKVWRGTVKGVLPRIK